MQRAESLDDLIVERVDVPVELPDGRIWVVALRPLPESEHFELRRSLVRPQPPRKEMTKTGPVYDYAAPEYLEAVAAQNERLSARVLLPMLPFAVPGTTDDERIAALRGKVGQKVYLQLVQAANRLNYISEEEIAQTAATFRAARPAGAPGDGAPASDAEPVAGAAAR